ncbi:restriction endonuclease subunit S [uncultured Porphyromonas sp.]|uniref:restriction endonuclease subunit S n=1 Tax=uncultured Porphyromonas sp. TaxID=159274 RepID=UPI0025EB2885|nr:restriction endonuclease subunit S [uncultured Porphyromonas sp.]
MTANKTKWVRLGDYIEVVDERNTEGKYSVEDVMGISLDKIFIDTKANMEGVALTPYKLVKPSEFCYVSVTSRNGGKISLAINSGEQTYLVSSSYVVFKCTEELLPEYLYLMLSRSEFDRYARFNSWGSARETFSREELCRVRIPLPSMEVQQELVATYEGLKRVAEDNEALIAPLTEACQAFIVDCKRQYPSVPLGDYIEEVREKNIDGLVTKVLGLSTQKEFREPSSRVNHSELSGYKIVRNSEFAYVPTTDTWKVFACALNKGETIVVSPIYVVFKVQSSNLLANFLYLILQSKEFDRYARFNSWGSARENFSWEELCRVQIPLPPLEVQQSIVNLYHCIEEAKSIAREARERLTTLCPALVQYAINA